MTGLPFEFTATQGDLIAASTVLLSLQYNFSNFYKGYLDASDKVHALVCMIPYFQINFMLFLASQYSQFWKEYPVWFVFGAGMLITNMTGNLNLRSCAKMRYNPFYIDTIIFAVILYLDYNRVFERNIIAGLYVYMVV